MHARTTIRQAATAILDAAPGISATVQDSKVWYIDTAILPLIGVYSNTEVLDIDQSSTDADYRIMDLEIDIHVEAADGAALALAADNLAEQVENALRADRSLGVGCQDIQAPDTDGVDNITTERARRALTLTFPVHYRTAPGAAGTII